jgi:hypothetical protein
MSDKLTDEELRKMEKIANSLSDPAYPMECLYEDYEGTTDEVSPYGISKMEYFVAKALQGILANPETTDLSSYAIVLHAAKIGKMCMMATGIPNDVLFGEEKAALEEALFPNRTKQ